MARLLILFVLFTCCIETAVAEPSGDDYAKLEALYLDLHRNPELSFMEAHTAARMADELAALGFTVTREFGGTGVVARLDNGAGPTVLVRADMDALPVPEQTGLPYASTVKGLSIDGDEKPVMHACGHDIHM
ncbi:MAG: M20/M25/M40 family metallo-hydrolase, partial [Gammaproteobacteria bacterium]